MKQLIWKELREQRFIPIICAILTMLVVITRGQPESRYAPLDEGYMTLMWYLTGLVAAAVAFSSENGNRTIDFLTALPITRTQIWLAKVLSGVITLTITAVSTCAVWALTYKLMYGVDHTFISEFLHGDFDTDPGYSVWNDNLPYRWLVISPIIPVFINALWCYAVALMIAPLVDRAIGGVIASMVGCIGLAAIIGLFLGYPFEMFPLTGVPKYYQFTDPQIYGILATYFLSPLCLAASHTIFKRGETLSFTPRFYAEARAFAGWIVTLLIALRGAYVLLHL